MSCGLGTSPEAVSTSLTQNREHALDLHSQLYPILHPPEKQQQYTNVNTLTHLFLMVKIAKSVDTECHDTFLQLFNSVSYGQSCSFINFAFSKLLSLYFM